MAHYADISEEYSGIKKSKVVIVQVPYEKTVTYKKGTSKGPAAIIESSKKMELYDDNAPLKPPRDENTQPQPEHR